MIKTTIYFFKDGYTPVAPLTIPTTHEVDLCFLPSVGENFKFVFTETSVNPNTDNIEDREVTVTGMVSSLRQIIKSDSTHSARLDVRVWEIEYDRFQPIPVSAHNIICKTAIGDMTVKAYLLELLWQLWDRGPEFFNAGSPFGYAEWQQEVYDALLESGHIKQTDSWREHKAFVLNMIHKNLWRI